MAKRRYRNSLEFVESGFLACWHNAQDLVAASKKLLDSGLHAPALSLAVLALEELAKLSAIDGLLFARHDDHKATRFAKASRSHAEKLMILELLPLLLGNLGRVDPRFGKEKRYHKALAISLQHLKADGNAVMEHLGEGAFQGLDEQKQKGFYASVSGGSFVAPREAVVVDVARAVYQLAWRATTTVDFLLKGGNLRRYIANARGIRASLSETDHQQLERLAGERFEEIFGAKDAPGGGEPPVDA